MMEKRFGVWDKKNEKFIQWFEYAIQAYNFIMRRFNNSSNFDIIRKNG